MISNEQVTQLEELIKNAESILVVYPKQPSTDILATAMGVFNVLTLQGKRVSVASPELPKEYQQLQISDIEKTVTEIGNQNLVISFDYTEEAIDKVSYHIGEDTKKFYLTIKPRSGYPPLDTENVDFSYTGVDADLVVLVGVKSLQDLEHIYFGYEELYDRAPLVNIQSNPGRSGIIEIATQSGESTSECVAQHFLSFQTIELQHEAATNFLRGIESATNHFTSLSATADTFETVAKLMRSGARRSKPVQQNTPVQPQVLEQKPKETKANEVSITSNTKALKQKNIDKNQAGSLNYTPSAGAPRGG